MSKSASRAERERNEANYQYFVSLANTRASLTSLPLMAFVTAFVLGITLPWLGSMIFDDGYDDLWLLFHLQIAFIAFSVVMLVLSLFQRWVFRCQVLTSSFMVLFVLAGWVYGPCLIATCLATVEIGMDGVARFVDMRLAVAAIIGPSYVAGATVVHVLLLKKRLREGHSEKRTLRNYLATSSAYSPKSLWIIFAAAIVGPNLLTGGRYVLVTVGTVMFLFLASVTPSLLVEFGYLTYLKSRDKKYWERQPSRAVVSRAQKKIVLKRVVKWALIVFAATAGVAVLNEVLPKIL
ncbi:hypothetical protein HQQ80_07725 [Microbacteriaceae bacterium VKM Ac-2855]|nr:hypothetical protein [Microbacteriaceae bacterium VKM Ac-2855]